MDSHPVFVEKKIDLSAENSIYLFNQRQACQPVKNITNSKLNQIKELLQSCGKESFELREKKICLEFEKYKQENCFEEDVSLVGFKYQKPDFADRRTNRTERRNDTKKNNLEAMYKISKNLNEILYIKTEAPYCEMFVKNQAMNPILLRTSFQAIEQYFMGDDLLKVHRSFLVNPKAIRSVVKEKRKHGIRLKGRRKKGQGIKMIIPIGRTYYYKLRKTHPELFS